MTLALLISSLIVFSAPAAKVAAAKTPEARLESAAEKFNRGELRAALKLLDAAASDPTASEETQAKLHLLRGQCFAAQQDLVKAETAFSLALEHDPTLTLDPARVDPNLVALLDKVRERMRGELKVTTDRAGAKVRIDGVELGVTPYRGTIAVGSHELGVETVKQRVIVYSQRLTEVTMTLPPPVASPESKKDENASAIARTRPFADLRTGFNPVNIANIGFELGAGLEAQYVRASIHFKVLQEFGVTPRGGLSVPLGDRWRLFAELELPCLFLPRGFAFGLGGAGGGEYSFLQWVSAFAEVGGRHFFVGGADGAFIQVGARLRIPGLSF